VAILECSIDGCDETSAFISWLWLCVICCVASECVLEGRTQRRAPLQAEMTGNDELIQINDKQEDGLCKQKSFSDLKITY
jgi:hypothetical protein